MKRHRAARRKLERHGVKIVHRAAGDYVARWLDPRSRRQVQQNLTLLGLSNDDAREKWARTKAQSIAVIRADIAAGRVQPGRRPLAEVAKEWVEKYENESTRAGFKMLLDRFVAWAANRGRLDIQDVTAIDLAAFAEDYARGAAFAPLVGAKRGRKGVTTRRRAPSTIALALRIVRMFFRWARRHGLTNLVSDDVLDALAPARIERREIRILRPAELRRLLQAALRHDAHVPKNARHRSEPIAPFVLAVLLSGCRFGEMATLPWSEVDLEAGEIRLSHSRVKTKAARAIRLDVSPSLALLLARMKLQATGPFVFGIERGRAEDARRRLVKTFGGPVFSWHDLRRTCASVLTCAPTIYGAASAFMTAARMGHDVAVLQQRYATLLPGLPATAKTIEAATGIEKDAKAIVESFGGGVPADAEAVAQ